jgi:NADH-quinone oxidoreductase subunit F
MYNIARRMRAGAGRVLDLDLIVEITENMGMMSGMSICGLPDGAAWPLRTVVQKFRKEFEQRIAEQEPDAAARQARQVNPAAYELPILQGRETAYVGGTFFLP